MQIDDDRARHVGQVTLAACVAGPALVLLALPFSTELPYLFEGGWFIFCCAGISVVAYAAAAVTARNHMADAPYLDDRDREGWEWRKGTKAAPLVPFIYLLSTPSERQVGAPRSRHSVW